MNRNDACALLTTIAQNELIDMPVSREILKARDIVVCEPNKLLDVMATQEARDTYKGRLIEYINCMLDEKSAFLSFTLRQKLYTLRDDVQNGFKDYVCCSDKFLDFRCKNCPKYWAHDEQTVGMRRQLDGND